MQSRATVLKLGVVVKQNSSLLNTINFIYNTLFKDSNESPMNFILTFRCFLHAGRTRSTGFSIRAFISLKAAIIKHIQLYSQIHTVILDLPSRIFLGRSCAQTFFISDWPMHNCSSNVSCHFKIFKWSHKSRQTNIVY